MGRSRQKHESRRRAALDVSLHVSAELGSLTAIRRLLDVWMELHAFDRARCIDAQLVVSELVTNAIEHGNGKRVEVDMSATPDGVVELCVKSESPNALPAVDDWNLPDQASRRGRGLALVHRVSRRVESSWSDGLLAVTAHVSVAPTA